MNVDKLKTVQFDLKKLVEKDVAKATEYDQLVIYKS